MGHGDMGSMGQWDMGTWGHGDRRWISEAWGVWMQSIVISKCVRANVECTKGVKEVFSEPTILRCSSIILNLSL